MKIRGLFHSLAIVVVVAAHEASAAPGDQNWDWRFGLAPGFNGPISAFAIIGTNLFVGGDFSRIGNLQASKVARWDGANWHALGGGISGGPGYYPGSVSCLATDGTNLFVGGQFNLAGGVAATNLARWDGQAWSGIEVEPSWGHVDALAVNNSKLYVGGHFFVVGGATATNIAVWDGVQWQSLGDGLDSSPGGYGGYSSGNVRALYVDGTNLYAGGFFGMSGATALTNVARWDGVQWQSLGDGLGGGYSDSVRAITRLGHRVLFGGMFPVASGMATTNLAWWDGSAWSACPTVTEISPTGFLADGSGVIVFGAFTYLAGGASSSAIARFDGTNWTSYGSGVLGTVHAAIRFGTNLFVGGEFQVAGGKSAGFIARWDGSAWQSLFPGRSGALFGWPASMTANANGVYVAGDFDSAGETPVQHVARFEGNNWTSMDAGLAAESYRLLSAVGTNLYLMERNSMDLSSAPTLRRWNGSTWSFVANDLTNEFGLGGWVSVSRLAANQTNLFVAGTFTGAGAVAATNLARWDGTQWHSVNYLPPQSGSRDGISTMTTRGEVLFIAEHYGDLPPPPGGDPILPNDTIRCWNGTNWTNVGGSLFFSREFDAVEQIVCLGSNLFAGGYFIVTNPVPATNLLRWDGNAWHAVDHPFGSDSGFGSLAVSGTNLYVRGWLGETNSLGAAGIAKWDGSRWSALGSGLASDRLSFGMPRSGPGAVSDMVTAGREVYLWGGFTMAGGKSSYQFALWHEFPTVNLSPRGWLTNGSFGLRILDSSGQTVRMQTSPDMTNWSNLALVTPDSNDYDIQIPASAAMARFYRALLVP